MAKLQIRLFGGLRVLGGGDTPVEIRGEKTQALLAYLVLNRERAHRRDKLSGLLWPDSMEEQARHSLRQTVLTLKKELEPTGAAAMLIAEGHEIALDLEAVSVDVEAFERLAAGDSRSALQDAASLYRGELLEGLRSRSELFDDWLSSERARLGELACDVLERLAALQLEAKDADEAIETGRRLMAIDPLREIAHRTLMRAYHLAGRRTASLQQYKTCEEVLRRELDVSPDPETIRLFEQLRGAQAASPPPGDPATLPATLRQRAGDRARPRSRGGLRRRWAMMMAASLLVAAAALLAWQPWRSPPDGSFGAKPSIAVLPLRNLSGSPGQDYFGDAVSEGIISALSRISKMFVVASSSTQAYKGRAVSPREVAKRLGVQYVLEGSFQRTANKLRVTVRLTNAEGNVIWSDRYDRGASDTFAVQDEIILRVITGLQIKLTEGEQERLSLVHGTTNLKAWEYAGQALLLLRRMKPEDNARARKLYEMAATLDPKYPGALDGLAWTHMFDAWFGWSGSAKASFGQAAKIAQKAYALDPDRPRTYALLGHLQLVKGDYKQAIAFGEKSIALSPSGADNHAILAYTYSFSGRPERAIELIERKAMKLSPLYPGYYRWILGRSYRLVGDHNRAIEVFTEHLKREPGFRFSRVELVTTYAEMGRFIEARRMAKEVLRIEPRFSLKNWARSLPYQDRAIAARELRALRQAGLPE